VDNLDFAGARDRVNRGFHNKAIDKTLEVRIIFGTFDKPLRFGRGIKPDCPLAMLLCIIHIEPLLLK